MNESIIIERLLASCTTLDGATLVHKHITLVTSRGVIERGDGVCRALLHRGSAEEPPVIHRAELLSPSVILALVTRDGELFSLLAVKDAVADWRIAHVHCSRSSTFDSHCSGQGGVATAGGGGGGSGSYAALRVLAAAAGIAAVAFAATRFEYRPFTTRAIAALLALEIVRVTGC